MFKCTELTRMRNQTLEHLVLDLYFQMQLAIFSEVWKLFMGTKGALNDSQFIWSPWEHDQPLCPVPPLWSNLTTRWVYWNLKEERMLGCTGFHCHYHKWSFKIWNSIPIDLLWKLMPATNNVYGHFSSLRRYDFENLMSLPWTLAWIRIHTPPNEQSWRFHTLKSFSPPTKFSFHRVVCVKFPMKL